MRSLLQACIFALLMGGAVFVASAWKPSHFLADDKPRVVLEALIPQSFGNWQIDPTIVPIPPSPDLQRVIDQTYDQTLARTYRNAQGQRVMLSLAYGRNQHKGMNTHRPEVCYPAQGFRITQEGARGTLAFGDRPIDVTRLVTVQGARNEPVTYWLIVGDQVIHFGYELKAATLKHGIRGNIPDGMLFRVSSIDPDSAKAFALQQNFVADLLAAMPLSARRLVLGIAGSPA